MGAWIAAHSLAECVCLTPTSETIMHTNSRPDRPAAVRTDLGAIFASLELSRSAWLITSLSPGSGEKMSKHVVRGGDIAGLLKRLLVLKERAHRRMNSGFTECWNRRALRATSSTRPRLRSHVGVGARRPTGPTVKHW
jgi:hypothetical protein